ncbi:MAG: hypothetical protein Q8P41_07525 [Pseudomonadota bacterium]|nr:hypothetical protein [Pseudomonadota bacterium]
MRLSLGNGPLPRLLAPGVPDWIGADGVRIGWTLRDRLFLRAGDHVEVVELPDEAEEVAASPRRWTVALGSGFVRVDPQAARIEELLVDDEAEPVATHAGEDLGLFLEVPEHRLLRLVDGRPLPLPDGALRARWIRPWATGFGAVWIDLDVIVRLGARTSVVGRAPSPEGIACGPEGGVLVAIKGDAVVAAPRGLAVRVGRTLDADSARFSPDGTSVLAACPDGVAWVDLATGAVRKVWDGSLAPVGFAPGPVLWDLDRGVLVDEAGTVLLDGFAGASPAMAGQVLAGPGGAVWDLASGTRGVADLRDGVCATDGERTVHVDDATVRVLGGGRFAHGLCGDEDAVDAARIDGDTLIVATLDGEVGRYTLPEGERRERTHQRSPWKRPPAPRPEGVTLTSDDAESRVGVGEATWPLPADGAARVAESVWAWSHEGALFALPAPPNS